MLFSFRKPRSEKEVQSLEESVRLRDPQIPANGFADHPAHNWFAQPTEPGASKPIFSENPDTKCEPLTSIIIVRQSCLAEVGYGTAVAVLKVN